MALIRKPLPVKLFFGLISAEPPLFPECISLLRSEYGDTDLESDIMPWCASEYYRNEMGGPLYRKFVFFAEPIVPDRLPSVKLFALGIEEKFCRTEAGARKRRLNADPGYLTEAKVVLATTKDFSHRIYIGDGIYAEVTLRFSGRDRTFTALDYTYADYRRKDHIVLFNEARGLLRDDLKRRKE